MAEFAPQFKRELENDENCHRRKVFICVERWHHLRGTSDGFRNPEACVYKFRRCSHTHPHWSYCWHTNFEQTIKPRRTDGRTYNLCIINCDRYIHYRRRGHAEVRHASGDQSTPGRAIQTSGWARGNEQKHRLVISVVCQRERERVLSDPWKVLMS